MALGSRSLRHFGISPVDICLWHLTLLCLFGFALWPSVGSAQRQPLSGFDTVSVRRSSVSTAPPAQAPLPNGGFKATNVTLQMLVSGAFRIRGNQLVGGPDWVRQDRFDILAQSNRDMGLDDMRRIVQALIKERFHLTLSDDRRQVLTYSLQPVNDRGGSPALERAAEGCEAKKLARFRAPAQEKPNAQVPPKPMIVGNCAPISLLASSLSLILEAEVVDSTGLSGSWNYRLMVHPSTPLPQGESRTGAFATLQSALSSQLGLFLKEERTTKDVLVIQSVEYPRVD